MKVGFLISGGLGELVLNYFVDKVEVEFVLTDKGSDNIINICKYNNVPVFAGNPRNSKIDSFLKDLQCDVIASVNYLFIVNKNVIDKAKYLCFNIHGSLLPKYRGRTPHVWSIINNEQQTGITAHKIDEGCDTGEIIKQISIAIESDDTGAIILDKYKEKYIPLIEEIFELFINGKLESYKQDDSKATYFGKRTPEDGRINWDWDFERIRNWVRAQAFPYPGAFTFYEGKKIIIDKVSRSDFGFHFQMENGTILNSDPLLIKCSNSALKVDLMRTSDVSFSINGKFI
jgi:methionyl-tRNA formyltransferase